VRVSIALLISLTLILVVLVVRVSRGILVLLIIISGSRKLAVMVMVVVVVVVVVLGCANKLLVQVVVGVLLNRMRQDFACSIFPSTNNGWGFTNSCVVWTFRQRGQHFGHHHLPYQDSTATVMLFICIMSSAV